MTVRGRRYEASGGNGKSAPWLSKACRLLPATYIPFAQCVFIVAYASSLIKQITDLPSTDGTDGTRR